MHNANLMSAFITGEDGTVLHAKLEFWPVVKKRRVFANRFTEAALGDWAKRLKIDIAKLEIVEGNRGIVLDDIWVDDLPTLAENISIQFCRFLDVFRPIMAGTSLEH